MAETLFTLHPSQAKVMASDARFIACIAGIRGGKTTVGAIWLLNEINKHREAGKLGDYLICAPTNKILEQSTLPKFKEFFPSDWGEWREQKGFFQLNWNRPGSQEPCRIFVRSMDEPDSVEGMDAFAAWMDEVGKMKEQAWVNVQGRLSVSEGRAIMTSTPYAVNWLFKNVYKKKDTDPTYGVFIWSSVDNPAFPREEYERAKKELPKAIFERRYEGAFTRLEGLVFPEFEEETHVIQPFDLPDHWVRFAGVDFGHSNPNAIVCIAEDPKEKKFYVYKEFYEAETLLKRLATFLQSEPLSYVMADEQGKQLIAELRQVYKVRNLQGADKTQNSASLQRIRTLLKEGRLFFFDRCTRTIAEFESYHYGPSTGEKDAPEKPVAKDNHTCDALKYAFSRMMQGLYQEIKPFDRKKMFAARRRAMVLDADPYTGYF